LSLDAVNQLNPFADAVSKDLGTTFTPVIGNQALVISQGMIVTMPINRMTATASVCSVMEEVDLMNISC